MGASPTVLALSAAKAVAVTVRAAAATARAARANVKAARVMAKVAALPELKAEGLAVADFSWMMPAGEKAPLYAQYGLEGLQMLWQSDTRSLLASGGVLRTYELLEGSPLRPSKLESSVINQLLAHRLFNQFVLRRAELLEQVR